MIKTSTSTTTTTLRGQLFRTFEDPTYRPPPLPMVALELAKLVAKDDVNVDQVVRLLERDQMMAGAVMRLVGSPIHAGRGPVRSLTDAVMRLGIRTVRDSVFDAALKKSVFKAPPEYAEIMTRIGRHGTAAAYLARIVARHARATEDQAFLGALLHDVGYAALILSVMRKKDALAPPLVELWPEIDALHEQASKAVTKLWGLSGELSLLVGSHHQEHNSNSSRTAAIITIADSMTGRFEANIVGPHGPDGTPLPACAISPVSVEESRALLGLREDALDRIEAEARPILLEVLQD
ncbi:MAG TPA: HDOD domain-containing protein [Polyangiaceae bacterium]|jgi:HD-like signal output (HDOD) protein|nr:HDOD domain-containing protein [Polyangiaceae bacterium]